METRPLKQKIRDYEWKFEGRSLRVGVGCAYLGGGADYRDAIPEKLPILERAYELGFRYYDTSSDYGTSECMLGELVKRVPRETIFLATKSPFPFRENPRDWHKAFEVFRENFYRSFERLQTDHIDLYQIHDTENFNVCEDEVVPFLLERKAEGLIDYIGTGMRLLNAHETAILSGDVDSVLSYLGYSLLTRAGKHTMDLAAKYGVSYVNASVLHFGAFKPENRERYENSRYRFSRREFERAQAMKALCDEMGVNVMQASLQYSLFNPNVDMLLNGINRMSNLDATIEAMRAAIRPEQWARIQALQDSWPEIDTQVNEMV